MRIKQGFHITFNFTGKKVMNVISGVSRVLLESVHH